MHVSILAREGERPSEHGNVPKFLLMRLDLSQEVQVNL
jgi:hypothetical protein